MRAHSAAAEGKAGARGRARIDTVSPLPELELSVTRPGWQGYERTADFDAGRETLDERLRALAASAPDAIVFDGATAAHLTEAGRLLEALGRRDPPLFVVGSSGAADFFEDARLGSG